MPFTRNVALVSVELRMALEHWEQGETRAEILQLLRRNGQMTAAELSEALNIGAVGVRPRNKSPSLGERTLISESTGSRPCCWRWRSEATRLLGISSPNALRRCDKLRQFARRCARIDIRLRSLNAFFRAGRRTSNV